MWEIPAMFRGMEDKASSLSRTRSILLLVFANLNGRAGSPQAESGRLPDFRFSR